MKTIYIPVSVEDELPTENITCMVFSKNSEPHMRSFYARPQRWGNIETAKYITHWLKPIQITEDKFNEIIK